MTAPSGRPPVGLVSAAIYVSVAAAASGAFVLVASATGGYGIVARVGGAGWVFLLSLIILMPTVTPFVKRLFMER
jgi:hypothetical protein